ncbi:indolepyruvate ferredoxin oxidoreductase family protein [Nocardioides sp.]|uniref:indolepyruvate ferredoxin oxidoreductase family protein n=1 Tax=Nocardioides sp. TaxID=35761 RepID=UPI0035B112A7
MADRDALDRRYAVGDDPVVLTGMQVLTRIVLDQVRADRAAGLHTAGFISGYPGSPIAGYDLELSRQSGLLADHDIVHQMGLNEELGLTAVAGSQVAHTRRDEMSFDGIVGAWYGKAPGLDRAIDALRHAAMAGSDPKGGVVAFVGDDPSAKSSTMPSASESVLASVGAAVLYPADQQELLDYGRHAIEMSRVSGLWTALKVVTDVADGTSSVDVRANRLTIIQPDLEVNGRRFRHNATGFLMPPATSRLEATLHTERPTIAARYAVANGLNKRVVESESDRVGLVVAGKTYHDTIETLASIGLDLDACRSLGIRIIKLGLIYPLDSAEIAEHVSGLDTVLVIEEKRSFIEAAIKDALFGTADAPKVVGKRASNGAPLLPADGTLDVDRLRPLLARYLAEQWQVAQARTWLDENQQAIRPLRSLPIVTRTAFVCSGCPHSSSMKTPDNSFVGTGTGCGCLTALQDPNISDGGLLMQMGGEGAQWIGMAPFLSRKHMTQNLGDGTWHHSGQLAVRAAAAAGIDITYKLFYNSAVAMTGGQAAPGRLSVPAMAESMLQDGVAQVIVTTEDLKRYRKVKMPRGVKVLDRSEIVAAQEELAQVKGVTVLIHDQECATEKRRKRKRGLVEEPPYRIMINERVCEGCGDCGVKSNCLSVEPVETDFGRKTKINQTTCNLDYSCIKGDCPSFLRIEPGKKSRRSSTTTELDRSDLPQPLLPSAQQPFAVRVCGIGGTGVVTVAQVLAQAAHVAGVDVHGMDQTGLAQKGGAVVSDLKFGPRTSVPASRVAGGGADLMLACDLLVAAEASNLATLAPGRTFAVGSTTESPTGAMVIDTAATKPDLGVVVDELQRIAGKERTSFFDAQALSVELFGGGQYANMMLVGAAYQLGALPLPDDAIEAAIETNGVAVAANVQAFRRGRQMVSDPSSLPASSHAKPQPALSGVVRNITTTVGVAPGGELEARIGDRVAELIAYQNAKYARRYAAVVKEVVEAERPLASFDLVDAVTFGLHKLMAYKDEYEVARLHADPRVRADVERDFGQGARVSLLLHPPILRALGVKNKVAFGPRLQWTMSALFRLKGLRGTPFDIFGYAKVRRVERQLIEEYVADVRWLLSRLTDENHALAVEVAQLPDLIRGYEDIKLDNVRVYRDRRAELMGKLELATGSSAPAPAAL